MYLKNGETGMARTKKVVEEAPKDEGLIIADCTKFMSIAFDRNNNLYGITSTGELFTFDWTNRKWVAV
jgi:hypothetical protein